MIERIKIGAHIHPVESVTTPALVEGDARADYDTRTLAIRVDTWNRPQSAIVEKLLHECIHAWCDDAGNPFPAKVEEKICTLLSPRLTAMLADNPDEIRHLLDMLAPK